MRWERCICHLAQYLFGCLCEASKPFSHTKRVIYFTVLKLGFYSGKRDFCFKKIVGIIFPWNNINLDWNCWINLKFCVFESFESFDNKQLDEKKKQRTTSVWRFTDKWFFVLNRRQNKAFSSLFCAAEENTLQPPPTF